MTSSKQKLQALLKQRKINASDKKNIPQRHSNTPARLSFGQERFWFLNQLMGPNPVYNIPLRVLLPPSLDLKALQASLVQLQQRHETLRTRFVEQHHTSENTDQQREIIQVVDPVCPVISIENVADQNALMAMCAEEQNAPFDLAFDTLTRMRLIGFGTAAQSRYALLVTFHHSVSDAWSTNLFFRDLVALYQANVQGTQAQLPPLTIQYSDYAIWQREQLQNSINNQLNYWRKQLHDVPTLLNLPTDKPRPDKQTFVGATVPVDFEGELVEQLNAICDKHGVSLFMLLISAFALLLARYSGQTDLLIGTPVANRGVKETENLIGFFVNTLVLRFNMEADPTLSAFLQQVKQTALDAFDHQDVPYERLVEEINPDRSVAYSPMFQVIFSLQNVAKEAATSSADNVADKNITDNNGQGELAFSPLTFEPTVQPNEPTQTSPESAIESQLESHIAHYDLTLNLEQTHNTIRGGLEFNTDLFEHATAKRMVSQLTELLNSMVKVLAQPQNVPASQQVISALPCISQAETAEQLTRWSSEQNRYPQQAVVHELFEHWAHTTPDAIAISRHKTQFSYGQINGAANQLARALRSRGVGLETSVGLCIEQSEYMLIAMLAILKAGGCYVPVDPDYPQERVGQIIEQSGCELVIGSEKALAGVAFMQHKISLFAFTTPAAKAEQHGYDSHNLSKTLTGACAQSLAYILYTSGSTGKPKGVPISHENITSLVTRCPVLSMSCTDVSGQMSNYVFDGFTFEVWSPLVAGARLTLISRPVSLEPGELQRTLMAEHVTRFFISTALFHQVVRENPGAFKTIDRVYIGGEPTFVEAVKDALKQPPGGLYNSYGPTECTTFAISGKMQRERVAEEQKVPIGLPLVNNQVVLVSPSGDADCALMPVGMVGEICIGGKGLARGYLSQPSLTAQRFIPNPYASEPGERLYRTGDLARRLNDGRIDYVGRVDHQVKIRGFRIELGEIERVILQHHQVQSAVVIVREQADVGKQVLAYIAAKSGQDKSGADFRTNVADYVSSKLPAYMLPSAYTVLAEMPLNQNRKIDRKALPEPDFTGQQTTFEAPVEELELLLAMLWRELLKTGRVGRNDNFFSLGGHSLLATQLLSRIQETFHVQLSITAIFENQTLASQASVIKAQKMAGSDAYGQAMVSAIVPLPENQPQWLSFAQQRLWFLHQFMGPNAVYNIPLALQLSGKVNHRALLASLSALVKRHESLRTRFAPYDDAAVQVVADNLDDISLEYVQSEQALREMARAEQQYQFDLTRELLSRIRLVQVENTGQIALLINLHHSIADGWSMGILFRELIACYRHFALDEPLALDALPCRYADFAAWQRQYMTGDTLEQQLDYWRSTLQGMPARLELPTDYPRPLQQGYQGYRAPFSLQGELVTKLQGYCEQHNVTLFMLLLSAFAVLLGQCSGQRDFAIGTSVANRTRKETEGLIGFFVNTLAIRCELNGTPTFAELLKRIKAQSIGAFAHQDIPFERLVEEIVATRDPSHSPLVQVMFALQNMPMDSAEFAGVDIAPLNLHEPQNTQNLTDPTNNNTPETLPGQPNSLEPHQKSVSRYDLTFTLHQTDDVIVGGLEYRGDLFAAQTINAMLAQFSEILAAIFVTPQYDVWSLASAQPESPESQQPQGIAAPAHNTLLDWCASALAGTPIDHYATCLAEQLVAKEIGAEEPVVITFSTHPAFLVAYFAVLRSGACPVILPPSLPDLHRQQLMEQERIRCSVDYHYLGDDVSGDSMSVNQKDSTELLNQSRFNPKSLVIRCDYETFLPFANLTRVAAHADRVAALLPPLFSDNLAVAVYQLPATEHGFFQGMFQGVCQGALAGISHRQLLAQMAAYTEHRGSHSTGSHFDQLVQALNGLVCDRAELNTPTGARSELNADSRGDIRNYLNNPALTAAQWRPDSRSKAPGSRILHTSETGARAGGLSRKFKPSQSVLKPARSQLSRLPLAPLQQAIAQHAHIAGSELLWRDEMDFYGNVRPRLVCFYSLSHELETQGQNGLEADLRKSLRQLDRCIPLPEKWVLLKSLPKTDSGRIKRSELQAMDLSGFDKPCIAPKNPTEQTLLALWQTQLGIQHISTDDNYFVLGGDSIRSIALVAQANRQGLAFSVKDLFAYPTIAQLATALTLNQGLSQDDQSPSSVAEQPSQLPAFSLISDKQREALFDQIESDQIVDAYPLSTMQLGMVTLSLRQPELNLYENFQLYQFQYAWQESLFKAALAFLLNQHPMLRTRFDLSGEQALQLVQQEAQLEFDVHDLSQLNDSETEAQLTSWMEQEKLRGIDLTQALWRARVFVISDNRFVFGLFLHHALWDGWSLESFATQLYALYDTLTQQQPLPEIQLLPGFNLFIAQEQQAIHSQRQQDYWLSRLEDCHLPWWTSAKRSPNTESSSRELYCPVSAEASAQVMALARTLGVQEKSVWCALYFGLLCLLDGSDNVTGLVLNQGRPEVADAEKTIGVFLNALPMALSVAGKSWKQLIVQTDQLLREQHAERWFPLAEMQRLSGLDLSGALFNYTNWHVYHNNDQATGADETHTSGLTPELTPQQTPQQPDKIGGWAETNYPLLLDAFKNEKLGRFWLKLTLDTGVFNAQACRRIEVYLQKLVHYLAYDSDSFINKRRLLGEQELQQQLVEWNQTHRQIKPDFLPELIAQQVSLQPHSVALVCDDHQLSYGELWQRSGQLAVYLRNRGLTPHHRVGVCLERTVEMVVALLGVLRAGCAYVPVDPHFPVSRQAYILADSGVEVVITQSTLLRQLSQLSEPYKSSQERLAFTCICIDKVLTQSHLIAPTAHLPVVLSPLCAQSPAYVIYTSGSTGHPKGVALSHSNVTHFLQTMQQQPGLTRDSRLLSVTTLSFDIAVLELFLPLVSGACVDIASQARAGEGTWLAARLAKQHITHMQATPSGWQVLQHAGWQGKPDLTALVGGEALTQALSLQLQQQVHSLWNMYGPTETAVWSVIQRQTPKQPSVSIGRPIGNTLVYVLDTHMHPVPIGVIGELYIGGCGVSQGYVNRAQLTAERFVPDPFSTEKGARLYRTGDRVRFDENGHLHYVGRADLQVKLRGFRIELGEIEQALLACEVNQIRIKQAVVVVHPMPASDSRLCAYVVPGVIDADVDADVAANGDAAQQDQDVFVAQLRLQLAARLPSYMVPSSFTLMNTLPLTANGKVNRKALPPPNSDTLRENVVAPEGELETLLASLWSDVLGGVQVSRFDSFFELGGHSLLATQLVARIREALGVELPLRMFFEQQSLQAQSEAIQHIIAQSHTDGAADNAADTMPALNPLASHEGLLPLSFAQQRLWFLNQIMGPNAVYNLFTAVCFVDHVNGDQVNEGKVNERALRKALHQLMLRQASLRTRFVCADNNPNAHDSESERVWQVIEPQPPEIAIEHCDSMQAIKTLAQEEQGYCFSLSNEPLCRIRLLKPQVSDAEKTAQLVLLVNMHHSISDGWSMTVFFRELMALYQENNQNQNQANDQATVLQKKGVSALPALPVQYVDYAQWQRNELSGAVLEAQIHYWREQLAGVAPLLPLPTDKIRPAEQRYRGNTLSLQLAQDLSEQAMVLSKAQGVTLFMLLESVFAVLMQQYSGQDDIPVGTPIANRTRTEIEHLIGFFANTLVLRNDLSGDPCFSELLKRVRDMALGAYAHQDIPFEQLIEELNPERSLSHAPLFQVMFVLQSLPVQNSGIASQQDGGILVEPLWQGSQNTVGTEEIESTEGTARFDLTLTLQETPKGLLCHLEYNSDLFERDTIARMLSHYQQLLASLVVAPSEPISRAVMLSHSEREQQCEQWNVPEVALPRLGLHHLFAAQAQNTPDRIALVDGLNQVSYQTLHRRANRLAHELIAHGVTSETPVGICTSRNSYMLVAMLAVLKAGGCYVPLDPDYPVSRLRFLVEDSGVRLVLSQTGLPERLFNDTSERDKVQWLLLDSAQPAVTAYSHCDQAPEVSVTPCHLAYVIYTSGSTGQPKGVGITHGSAVSLLQWALKQWTEAQRSGILATTSMCFDLSVYELFLPLLGGTTCVLADNILALPSLLQSSRVSLVNTVPSAAQALLVESGFPRQVKVINLAGEPLKTALVEQLYQHTHVEHVFDLYGPSEDTTYSTFTRRLSGERESIGRPIANTRAYVLNSAGNLVPPGVAGELYLGGHGLARGYVGVAKGRAGLSADKFVPDPFSNKPGSRLYRTGDLVRYLNDGRLVYLGRLDHQVKVRGFRIELGEIENVLLAHAQVSEAVAHVHTPDDAVQATNTGPQIVAYVVLADATGVSNTQLQALLSQHLPGFMQPAALLILDQFPRTANGKIDRKRLPLPDFNALRAVYQAPLGETEIHLAALWQGLLSVNEVGRDDNFFTLGGHSLLATQLVSQIRDTFNSELTIRDVFEAQTLQQQAACILNISQHPSAATELTPILPVATDTPVLLSFAQQRLWFLNRFDGSNAVYNIPLALRFNGKVNPELLIKSLQTVVQRHEALRTRFIAHHDSARLEVQSSPLSVAIETVTDTEALMQIARAEQMHPFDLNGEALCRFRLLHDQSDGAQHGSFVLLATLHHSIADAWSLGILFKELVLCYEAGVKGEAARLPPLAIQYRDFAHWQRHWLQPQSSMLQENEQQNSSPYEQQMHYWRTQLSGLPPVLNLPTDRPRPNQQSYRGGNIGFVLDKPLSDQLQALSQSLNGTLFMTLISAFGVLMSRYSGQTDFALGTPVANRTRKETEGLIGFFVNTLVLRFNLAGEPLFSELLSQTREHALQAYANQDIPFEKLIEEINPERSTAYSPLFQVMFALQNVPANTATFADINVMPLQFDEGNPHRDGSEDGVSRFDLWLNMSQTEDGLLGNLEYNADLFNRETAVQLTEHFQRLLQAIVAQPQGCISDYPFLTESEVEYQLGLYGSVAPKSHPEPDSAGYPNLAAETLGLHQLIEQQAAMHPDAIALMLPASHTRPPAAMSFATLNQQANRLAHYLQQQGVSNEQPVAVYLNQGTQRIVALLAVLKLGAAYIPVQEDYPASRIHYMLNDANAALLLTETALAQAYVAGNDIAPKVVCIDAQSVQQALPQASVANIDSLRSWSQQACYLIYTSGSTGTPKGVVGTHGSVINRISWFHREMGTARREIHCQKTGMGFVDHVAEIFQALSAGAALLLLPPDSVRSPVQLQTCLSRYHIHQLTLVPSLLDVLLKDRQFVLPQIRTVISSGEALQLADLQVFEQHFPNARLFNFYGSTEVGADVCSFGLSDAAKSAQFDDKLSSLSPVIGRPISGNRVYVLDKRHNLLPLGAVGQLAVSGVGLARGYHGKAALTAERFIPDPFVNTTTGEGGDRLYLTGDLVRFLPGLSQQDTPILDFVGRTDQQVKVRGVRVELEEVAQQITAFPDCLDAVVVARQRNQTIVLDAYALVESSQRTNDSALVDAIMQYLRRRLPHYMLPASITLLAQWPLSASGKLNRQALPEPVLSQQAAETFVPPNTTSETLLANVWQQLLLLTQVGRFDNFFSLGGHSLLVTQLISRIREIFSVELDIRAVFEQQQLFEQAALIDNALRTGTGKNTGEQASSKTDPIPIAPPNALPRLSFAQQRLWFLNAFIGPNAVYNMPMALKLSGKVNIEALFTACDALFMRHEALRTRFEEHHGEARQIIDATSPFAKPPKVEKVSTTAELVDIWQFEQAYCFDLSRDSLCRIRLVDVPGTLADKTETDDIQEQGYLAMLITMHHSVSDAWSLSIFFRELLALYEAALARQSAESDKNAIDLSHALPPLPIQYRDYSHWQREYLQAEALEQQLSYWQQQLRGLPDVLSLPTDFPRPPTQTYRGGVVPVAIEPALLTQLQQLSQQQGVTLYMTLLSAFAVLLSRYSGQGDVAIGSPIANRNRAETENLIGFFVNTLVMRCRVDQAPSFSQLLQQVRTSSLNAYAHQDVPFERLVELLSPDRNTAHSPLFQVMFALQNVPISGEQVSGLDIAPLTFEQHGQTPQDDHGTARFDLTLSLRETPSGLAGGMEYNADIFERDSITRMVQYFEQLLKGIIADPGLPTASYSLVTENDSNNVYIANNKVNEQAHIAYHGDSFGVSHGAEAPSVGDENASFVAQAIRLASVLAEQGIKSHTPVGLMVDASEDCIIAAMALAQCGALCVPLSVDVPALRQQYLLALFGVSTLLGSAENLAGVQANGQTLTMQQSPLLPLSFEHLKSLMPSNQVEKASVSYRFTLAAPGRYLTFPKSSQTNAVALQIQGQTRDNAVDGAYLISHNTLVNWVANPALNPMDVYGVLGLSRGVGVGYLLGLWQQLWLGQPLNASKLWRELHSDLSNELHSELAGGMLQAQERQFAPFQPRIVDTLQQPQAKGLVGELCFAGDDLPEQFYQFDASQQVMKTPLGDVIRSGLLARVRNNNRIELIANQEKHVNPLPWEINVADLPITEAAIQEAVIGYRVINDRLQCVCFYVPQQGLTKNQTAEKAISGYLRQLSVVHALPHRYVALEVLNRDAFGNIDIDALTMVNNNGQLEGEIDGEHGSLPKGATEELLAGIWESLLEVTQVKRDDNFFDLGGHSLLATQLATRIRDVFGLSVAIRDLFDQQILKAQAHAIDALRQQENTTQSLGQKGDEAIPSAATTPPELKPVSRHEPLLQSYAQQRLWFLQRLMGPNAVYNMPLALQIQAVPGKDKLIPVNETALISSLNHIVARHEVLRTRLGEQAGQAVQWIAEAEAIHIEPLDFASSLPALQRKETQHRFALSQESLCRIRLLKDTANRSQPSQYALLVTLHHSISDGWSLNVFMREFEILYHAYCADPQLQHNPLPPLAVQYADFAMWQRDYLQGNVLNTQLDYWRQQLAGLAPLLPLPTDKPRPVEQRFRGGVLPVQLPKALSQQARELSKQQGVTLFMLLESAFAILMQKYSGQNDIAVGTPIANRTQQETENLIGFFANTLVMRNDLSGNPTFSEVLKRCRDMALSAYAHQDIPFEQLIEELNPQRNLSHSPLFQVMFMLQNLPVSGATNADVLIAPLALDAVSPVSDDENQKGAIPESTSRFDLTLTLHDTPEGLFGNMEYNSDIFEPETITRMLAQFERLVQCLIESPEQPIAFANMLSEQEYQQQIEHWNQADSAFGRTLQSTRKKDVFLPALIEHQQRLSKDAIAAVFASQQLSYHALWQRSGLVAATLLEQGAQPGERIALCIERSLDMLIGLVAILRAGCAYVPVDPAFPMSRQAYILADSQVAMVLTQASLEDTLLANTSISASQLVVLEQCLAEQAKSRLASANSLATPAITAHSPAYVIYTSGSTGKPKGVVLSHGNMSNFLQAMNSSPGFGAHDRMLALTTLSFDIAVLELFLPLINGGCVDIVASDSVTDGACLAARLREQQITQMQATPSGWQLLQEANWQGEPTLQAIIGGEALSQAQAISLSKSVGSLWNMYGPTEATVYATSQRQTATQDKVLIGSPVAGTQCYILNEAMQPLPIGAIGELYLGGEGIAQGYWQRSALTAERFVPDLYSQIPGARLYRTGDWARFTGDGKLDYLGRIDSQVKLRGYRIELGEIEQALVTQPSVEECVVMIHTITPGDSRLFAYVVLGSTFETEGHSPVEQCALLREILAQVLPTYMVPSAIIPMTAFPRMANGKTDRSALPVPDYQGQRRTYEAPETDTEKQLAELWQALLSVEPIGRQDNFFELGGHSLLVTQLVSRIRETFGAELGVKTLFESQTLQQQGQELDRALATMASQPLTRTTKLQQNKQQLADAADALDEGEI